MSGFKDMLRADNTNVFMNLNEFAEKRTIIYDGVTYTDIPVVLTGRKEQDRAQLRKIRNDDYTQGLYLVSSVLHCKVSDLNDNQPEKGQRIKINHKEGGGGYFSEFYVISSVCEAGMLRVGLEAIDE